MRKSMTPVALGLALLASQALAAEPEDKAAPAAKPACITAEVNPVTGHALCINPLGAPVEAPPSASEVPCQTEAHPSGAWTWGPKCQSVPEG
jgi:hypothetical protein